MPTTRVRLFVSAVVPKKEEAQPIAPVVVVCNFTLIVVLSLKKVSKLEVSPKTLYSAPLQFVDRLTRSPDVIVNIARLPGAAEGAAKTI